DLQQYAGQQVVNGNQAHAYADQFIALHLSQIGQGKPYSYWSTQARTEKDATKKAALNDTVQTIFRGETLRSMLNQAWAFWTLGDVAMYGAIGLALATLIVFLALVFELFFAPKPEKEPVRRTAYAPSAS